MGREYTNIRYSSEAAGGGDVQMALSRVPLGGGDTQWAHSRPPSATVPQAARVSAAKREFREPPKCVEPPPEYYILYDRYVLGDLFSNT